MGCHFEPGPISAVPRAGFDDADGIQAAGVDDHAAFDLGLAEKRMPLAAHRDLESLAVRELQELRDILRRAGSEQPNRPLVHDVSKVVCCRLQSGIIEIQVPAEILQFIAQRLRLGPVIPRRLQRKKCRTAREPLAEVAARNAPLHVSALLVDD